MILYLWYSLEFPFQFPKFKIEFTWFYWENSIQFSSTVKGESGHEKSNRVLWFSVGLIYSALSFYVLSLLENFSRFGLSMSGLLLFSSKIWFFHSKWKIFIWVLGWELDLRLIVLRFSCARSKRYHHSCRFSSSDFMLSLQFLWLCILLWAEEL